MSPYLAVADLDDGTFAIVAIDPTIRVKDGCCAIVQSLHQTRDDAERALNAGRAAPSMKQEQSHEERSLSQKADRG